MTYELVLNKNGITVRELRIGPIKGSERWVDLEIIQYNELLSLSDGLNIRVTSIKPEIKDGVLVELKFKVSDFSWIKPPVKPQMIPLDKIPPEIIKIVNDGIKAGEFPPHFVNFTRQLYQPGTEPYLIKKIIKEKGRIIDKDLREMLKNEGYSPKSGGINATINVLERVTQEVKVEGRGENKTYIWVGK